MAVAFSLALNIGFVSTHGYMHEQLAATEPKPVGDSDATAVRFRNGRATNGVAELEAAPCGAHELLTELLLGADGFWCVARTNIGLESRAVMFGQTVAVAIGGESADEAAGLLLSAVVEHVEGTNGEA